MGLLKPPVRASRVLLMIEIIYIYESCIEGEEEIIYSTI
jgi:hypothetical protein